MNTSTTHQIHSDHNGVTVAATSEFNGLQVDGHLYTVTAGSTSLVLSFQLGPVGTRGVNGITTESLLAAILHRTRVLDAAFPCEENKAAILHMELALETLELRTSRRLARSVEGKNLE